VNFNFITAACAEARSITLDTIKAMRKPQTFSLGCVDITSSPLEGRVGLTAKIGKGEYATVHSSASSLGCCVQGISSAVEIMVYVIPLCPGNCKSGFFPPLTALGVHHGNVTASPRQSMINTLPKPAIAARHDSDRTV
jgi:hypothetical protein